MPRNVRNFWITLKVDGKRTTVATGPVKKEGGFELTVRQRDKGGIVTAAQLWGHVNDLGHIILEAYTADRARGFEVRTER